VFYNGREKRSAIETLKLSDAFEDNTEEPMLELICTVYNINHGMNEKLMDKCAVLMQYSQFIDKVREYEKEDSEIPIQEAIEWCIENDILREFLQARGQEVIKAMTIDMTWEHREELIRRDERAEGREEGREEGIIAMISKALSNGKTPEEIAEFLGIEIEIIIRIQKEIGIK